MNRSHVGAALKEARGKVKEDVGHVTSQFGLKRKGLIERVKGKFQHTLGDLKDAMKSGVDKVLKHEKKH